MACNDGIAAFTASTVVMMLAPGWRKISMFTDGLPLRKPACRTDLLRVDHIADILQTNRAAVVVSHDQRLVIDGLGDLVVRKDIRRNVAVGDLALGQVRVLPRHHLLHRRQADSVAGKLVGIQLDRAPPAATLQPPSTWPTPEICEMRCEITVEASS